jgi:hypothetical protein
MVGCFEARVGAALGDAASSNTTALEGAALGVTDASSGRIPVEVGADVASTSTPIMVGCIEINVEDDESSTVVGAAVGGGRRRIRHEGTNAFARRIRRPCSFRRRSSSHRAILLLRQCRTLVGSLSADLFLTLMMMLFAFLDEYVPIF